MFELVVLAAQLSNPSWPAQTENPVTDRCDSHRWTTTESDELQRQVRLTEAKILELVEDYRSGMSVAKVAARYGIHRTTVLAHLERANVPRRPKVRALTASQIRTAAARQQAGESYARIARDYDVHAETVRRWVLRAEAERHA